MDVKVQIIEIEKINIFTIQQGCAIILWEPCPSSINCFIMRFTTVNHGFNTSPSFLSLGTVSTPLKMSSDTYDLFKILLKISNLIVDKVGISKEFCIKIDVTIKPAHSQRKHECIIHATKLEFIARIDIYIFSFDPFKVILESSFFSSRRE